MIHRRYFKFPTPNSEIRTRSNVPKLLGCSSSHRTSETLQQKKDKTASHRFCLSYKLTLAFSAAVMMLPTGCSRSSKNSLPPVRHGCPGRATRNVSGTPGGGAGRVRRSCVRVSGTSGSPLSIGQLVKKGDVLFVIDPLASGRFDAASRSGAHGCNSRTPNARGSHRAVAGSKAISTEEGCARFAIPGQSALLAAEATRFSKTRSRIAGACADWRAGHAPS